MRTIHLIITLFIFTTLSCKAQHIIPIEDYHNYPNDIPDGAYIKDVNNKLAKFLGTWKGTYNSKVYEFLIVKSTKEYSKLYFKLDRLLIRYKITDTNGVIIENTTSLEDDSMYTIKGNYLAETGTYVLSYQGRKSNCGQNGNIFISVFGDNKDKMQLFLYPKGESYDCDDPRGFVEQILPTDEIILTKQ